MDRVVQKYLARYAEPESHTPPEGDWDCVLVVPACGEDPTFAARLLDGAPGNLRLLLVVVVNATDAHAPWVHDRNATLLGELATMGPAVHAIDRASAGQRIPRDQGVGLARKIGTDTALRLWAEGRVRARLLHQTDADATLPPDYFRVDRFEGAARLWPFRHVPAGDAELDAAHAIYELSLRYYVAGLAWAGSPYAFHTVGSTLSLDPLAYAQVRGYPRRAAGEDFHLLNKLAKVGTIVRPPGDAPPLHLSARHSDRVPFGTGPAVADILRNGGQRKVYDPRCFAALRAWLRRLERAAAAEVWSPGPDDPLPAELGDPLARAVAALELEPDLVDLVERHRGPSLRHQLRVRFDGLATLRLIHQLRDHAWPSIPWPQALAAAPFAPDPGPDPEILCQTMAQLE